MRKPFSYAVTVLFGLSLCGQSPSIDRSAKAITNLGSLKDAFQEFEKKQPAFVEQKLREAGLTKADIDKQLASGKQIPEPNREHVQQVVDGSPSPRPLLGGKLGNVVPKVPTLIPDFTTDEEQKLLKLGESVGRIERLDGKGGATLQGTGFVAA